MIRTPMLFRKCTFYYNQRCKKVQHSHDLHEFLKRRQYSRVGIDTKVNVDPLHWLNFVGLVKEWERISVSRNNRDKRIDILFGPVDKKIT